MILGIDYGSKLAGTTVIARLYEYNKVDFFSSEKGKDADRFILDFVKENSDIWLVYIDAPLSLPKIYPKGEVDGDFFYRLADRETGAMSPLFLGGLTARAMRLKRELTKMGIQVVETYPKKLAEIMRLNDLGYKKDKEKKEEICLRIKQQMKLDFGLDLKTWHEVDALLCLVSAIRNELEQSIRFGEKEEGQIVV